MTDATIKKDITEGILKSEGIWKSTARLSRIVKTILSMFSLLFSRNQGNILRMVNY